MHQARVGGFMAEGTGSAVEDTRIPSQVFDRRTFNGWSAYLALSLDDIPYPLQERALGDEGDCRFTIRGKAEAGRVLHRAKGTSEMIWP